MLKTIDKKIYECEVCKKEFADTFEARMHTHDIIYLPIEMSDLKSLINFIQTGNSQFLSESLVSLLLKYSSTRPERPLKSFQTDEN